MSVRIPNRLAPLFFGGRLSAIMVGIVSGLVLAISQGIHQGCAASSAALLYESPSEQICRPGEQRDEEPVDAPSRARQSARLEPR